MPSSSCKNATVLQDRKNAKFAPAQIKHKILMKYEKCIVSDSYFAVVCENICKILAKYKKCIAGLTDFVRFTRECQQ